MPDNVRKANTLNELFYLPLPPRRSPFLHVQVVLPKAELGGGLKCDAAGEAAVAGEAGRVGAVSDGPGALLLLLLLLTGALRRRGLVPMHHNGKP